MGNSAGKEDEYYDEDEFLAISSQEDEDQPAAKTKQFISEAQVKKLKFEASAI